MYVDVGASYPQILSCRAAPGRQTQLKTTCQELSAERLLATGLRTDLSHDQPAAKSCSAHRTWQVVFSKRPC
jgi:hypothetical protein